MIRAFRSTLEDMEDKRSVHSIHSLRSTRSYLLNRPVSDISYIDEESATKTGQTTLINRNNNQGGTLTVPPARGQSAGGGGGGSGNNSGRVKSHGGGMCGGGIAPITNTLNMNNNNVGGGSITVPVPTNTSATNCKATTETAYRVQTKGLDGRRGKNKSKGCSDAQTQSSESSFTVAAAAEQQSAENVFDQQQQPQPVSTSGICVQVESLVSQVTSTQTPPQTSILPPSTSPLPMAAAAAAASGLMPPAAAVGAATLLPSPIYPAPGFGYDPSYCQFLGQAADGYQYELVRRPSIGAAVAAAVVPPPPPQQPLQTSVSAAAGTAADCLLVPATPFNQQRRLSGSQSPVPHAQFNPVAGIHPTRSSSPNPHLVSLAASMPGSFDSCAGPPPPTTPIFIQQHQPHPILAPSAAQAVSASRAPQSIVMSSVVSGSPRHFMTTAPPNLYATPTGGGPSGYQPPPLVDPASYATNTTDCSWQTAPSSLPTNPTPHATSTGSDLPKPIQETSI